jgi:hypothetical protein
VSGYGRFDDAAGFIGRSWKGGMMPAKSPINSADAFHERQSTRVASHVMKPLSIIILRLMQERCCLSTCNVISHRTRYDLDGDT